MVIDKDKIIIGGRRIKIDSIFGYYTYNNKNLVIERLLLDNIDEFDISFENELDLKITIDELDSLFVLNINNYKRKEKLIELNKDEM